MSDTHEQNEQKLRWRETAALLGLDPDDYPGELSEPEVIEVADTFPTPEEFTSRESEEDSNGPGDEPNQETDSAPVVAYHAPPTNDVDSAEHSHDPSDSTSVTVVDPVADASSINETSMGEDSASTDVPPEESEDEDEIVITEMETHLSETDEENQDEDAPNKRKRKRRSSSRRRSRSRKGKSKEEDGPELDHETEPETAETAKAAEETNECEVNSEGSAEASSEVDLDKEDAKPRKRRSRRRKRKRKDENGSESDSTSESSKVRSDESEYDSEPDESHDYDIMDDEVDNFSDWKVPSWNELIASLYRPDR